MKLAQLHEAKYAGKFSNQDVLRQYIKADKIFHTDTDSKVFMQNAKILDNNERKTVQAVFVCYTDNEDEAKRWVKQYHERYNIPFGQFEHSFALDHVDRDEWYLYVTYDGHSGAYDGWNTSTVIGQGSR